MTENTYGFVKRLDFIGSAIQDLQPRRVLDIGCGTGENLTRPLAGRFQQIEFVAIDSDRKSIDFAKHSNQCSNATYIHDSEAGDLGVFDMVIASEVLEHVEAPIEFLKSIRRHLSEEGAAVITLPNGYGPFEWASLIESLWFFSRGYRFLHAVRQRDHMLQADNPAADTLAVSPHINFFAYGQVRSLLTAAGFRISIFRSRTFLCGFGFDHLIRSKSIISWNCGIADRLPPQLVSAWMFVLKPSAETHPQPFSRNLYSRVRRYLNERRWKVH